MSIIEKATIIATKAHEGQTRKEGDTPYIVHPFMVAFKLSGYGFSEKEISAALVHDVLEDTKYTENHLLEELGEDVLKIVKELTQDDSLSWEEKKKKYIEGLRKAPVEVKAVATADKIHNLESLFCNYSKIGDEIWKVFNRGKESKLWFEESVLEAIKEGWDHPIISEYEELVEKFKLM